MLPALYKPAVSYLRVVCDTILLCFTCIICCVPCCFIIMSYCVCSRAGAGGGGGVGFPVWWVGGHSFVVRVSPDCLLGQGSYANLARGMACRMSNVRSFLFG